MDGAGPQSGTKGADAALLLQVWLSPAFPTGAFAYSHGLEWAAEQGAVRDRASLKDWLADLVRLGSLRNDLILLTAAWHACRNRDAAQFETVAELALALQPSAERHLESVGQGNAFRTAVRAAWPSDTQTWADAAWSDDLALPVAVAVAAAGHDVDLPSALEAYAVAFVGNLVSAAIRLSVIGQTDGQRLIAELLPALRIAASAAQATKLDDIGGATFAADLAAIHHETQYTRLFRS